MKFLTENKDVLALGVSLLALVVSLVSTRLTLRATRKIAENASEHNLRLALNATYQRIHELLVDPKAAEGRRLLFQAHKKQWYPNLGDNDWDSINYSLALYDTLAGYVNRHQVDESVVLDAWHHPLVNIATPVGEFMAHRRIQGVHQPWAHLVDLLHKAKAYECNCPGGDNQ